MCVHIRDKRENNKYVATLWLEQLTTGEHNPIADDREIDDLIST